MTNTIKYIRHSSAALNDIGTQYVSYVCHNQQANAKADERGYKKIQPNVDGKADGK